MDKCANFPELIIQIFKIDFQNVANLEARLAYYEVSVIYDCCLFVVDSNGLLFLFCCS
jgi:hypothetical protein